MQSRHSPLFTVKQIVAMLTSLVLLVTLSGMTAAPAWAKTVKTKRVATQSIGKRVTRVPAPAFRDMPTATSNNARYADLIIDATTGEILHQENADAPRRPASLTKMMTLYLTFQALDSGKLRLDSLLPVSALAQAQSPTKLDLREGQRIATEDAILGLVTESANDAAVVLAEAIGGNIDNFADRMTLMAHRLGMNSTTYHNPNGLPDPEQVTTARDQAKLALALQRHFPRYYHYFSTPTFAYGGRMHPNHNRLMARYEGMDGIKTGFIRESGFNLVASCKRGDKRLIGVIFGGPSAAGRDNQLAALLDAAFARINGGNGGGPDAGTLPPMQVAATANRDPAPFTPRYMTKPSEVTSADADIVAAAANDNRVSNNGDDRTAGQGDAQLDPQAYAGAGTLQRPSQSDGSAKPPVRMAANSTAATPKPSRQTSGANAASSTANWGIQIGAYNDRASGQRATALVADTMPDLLGSAAPRVLSVATGTGTIYRARLVGVEEAAARTACNRLQAKGQPCMTLPPGNGGGNAWLASATE